MRLGARSALRSPDQIEIQRRPELSAWQRSTVLTIPTFADSNSHRTADEKYVVVVPIAVYDSSVTCKYVVVVPPCGVYEIMSKIGGK